MFSKLKRVFSSKADGGPAGDCIPEPEPQKPVNKYPFNWELEDPARFPCGCAWGQCPHMMIDVLTSYTPEQLDQFAEKVPLYDRAWQSEKLWLSVEDFTEEYKRNRKIEKHRIKRRKKIAEKKRVLAECRSLKGKVSIDTDLHDLRCMGTVWDFLEAATRVFLANKDLVDQVELPFLVSIHDAEGEAILKLYTVDPDIMFPSMSVFDFSIPRKSDFDACVDIVSTQSARYVPANPAYEDDFVASKGVPCLPYYDATPLYTPVSARCLTDFQFAMGNTSRIVNEYKNCKEPEVESVVTVEPERRIVPYAGVTTVYYAEATLAVSTFFVEILPFFAEGFMDQIPPHLPFILPQEVAAAVVMCDTKYEAVAVPNVAYFRVAGFDNFMIDTFMAQGDFGFSLIQKTNDIAPLKAITYADDKDIIAIQDSTVRTSKGTKRSHPKVDPRKKRRKRSKRTKSKSKSTDAKSATSSSADESLTVANEVQLVDISTAPEQDNGIITDDKPVKRSFFGRLKVAIGKCVYKMCHGRKDRC